MRIENKIEKLAYRFYLKRGRKDGYALDDWLKAESRILRSKDIKDFLDLLVKLAMIAGVIWALIQGISTNRRTDLNIELANRPFISIENPYWWRFENTDWFCSMFTMHNYGNKPAEEFKFRNLRVIVFRIDNDKIIQKIKERITNDQKQYLQGYLLDERNKFYLELMQVLSEYFKKNPDVNKLDATEFLSSLSKELKEKPIFSYKGELFFSIIEINNDMADYYKSQKHLVSPNQSEVRGLLTQIGQSGINEVLDGNNLLVVYWAIRYKGFKKDKEYSTFYLGYCDKNFLTEDKNVFLGFEGKVYYRLKEFKSWSRDEYCKEK